MVYNYIRMGEYYYFFLFFLPRLHASSSSSSSHETPGGVEARRALTFCNLVTFCPYRTYVRKKIFKKYLQTTCFYGIIMLEVEKGVLYMKRLGALSFHYIIYIAKNFLEKLLKKGCNFLFVLI